MENVAMRKNGNKPHPNQTRTRIYRKAVAMLTASLIGLALLPGCHAKSVTTSNPALSVAPTAVPSPTMTPEPTKNPNAKYIALTFDDGPVLNNTERLLEILKEKKVKATFFVLGTNVEKYPEIIKKISDAGHEIGSHGYDHTVLTKKSVTTEEIKNQMDRTNSLISAITGSQPTSFRPPQGYFNSTVQNFAKERNMAIIHWSYQSCPEDWKNKDPEKIAQFVIENAKNGHIVLLHDLHSYTVDAISAMLDGLTAKGFEFVTVRELIEMGPDKEEIPGKVYYYYNTPTKPIK